MPTSTQTEKSVRKDPLSLRPVRFFEWRYQSLGIPAAHENYAKARDTTIEAWIRLLELRDNETEEHSLRVSTMTVQLAQALGIPNADLVHVRWGALLHDIGKTKVPDRILFKPGKLTDEEWDIMRQHPSRAAEILAESPLLEPALDIPHYHHERWDGNGYPFGLKGDKIPLAARVIAVIDVWDALNSDRPYRKAWPVEKAFNYIRTQSGTHFDPQVVEVFFHLI